MRDGGLLILQDSAQQSDSPELTHFQRWFNSHFHEPYFKDYVRDDLAGAARESGFEVQDVETHFVSKVVVARKV